jgi:hypothetical protein
MILGRLRRGELLVLLGLIGLVVAVGRDWFTVAFGSSRSIARFAGAQAGGTTGGGAPRADDLEFGADQSLIGADVDGSLGWRLLGHPWWELLALFGVVLIVVLVLALRAGPGKPTYGAVVSLVLAIPLGALVLLTTLVRTLLLGPGIDGVPSDVVALDPAAGAWIGLASILVALVGLWVAMADARTDAPASTYVPQAGRPVPPLRPDAPDPPSPRD